MELNETLTGHARWKRKLTNKNKTLKKAALARGLVFPSGNFLLEQREDVLRRGIGNRKRLDRKLLLGLECRELG
jgi:hypothetical protein